MHTILVVEDEKDILELISLNLKRHDYAVLEAGDGNAAVEMAKIHLPDLIILDLMLPGKDGYTVFKELRQDARTRSVPVIILTAKADVAHRILGLELGADEYMGKPFSPKELMLRVKALLRRTKRVAVDATLKVGDFLIERNSLKAFVSGRQVDLTATEFKLLRVFAESGGIILERDALLREVWGFSDNTMTRTLDTHVKRLREKLGPHAICVRTLRGVGYQFNPTI
jgi:two-component system, OmpR family, phosphate regulon response regulator PhoB